MKHLNRCVSVRLLGLIGVLATSACSTSGGARAPETSPAGKQTVTGTGVPTMSLEAVAINGKSLGDDPKPQINASPGDIITAEVCIRDWSPNDEPLSGYQAALLPASFASGRSGLIEPVQYAALQKAGSPNPANSFIDDDHPRFVHLGLKTLALADTRAVRQNILHFRARVLATGLSSNRGKEDTLADRRWCSHSQILIRQGSRHSESWRRYQTRRSEFSILGPP